MEEVKEEEKMLKEDRQQYLKQVKPVFLVGKVFADGFALVAKLQELIDSKSFDLWHSCNLHLLALDVLKTGIKK